MTVTAIHTAVEELRFRLGGGLYGPGQAEYADACRLFNAMVERRPRFVARCVAADDVVAVLAFAREQKLELTVRSGGHAVTGACLNDDGIVLDVRGMDDVQVDPGRRTVRVGGGSTWGQVDRATQEHGLATTGGRVSTTGVAGLTMGGGSGWLERKHGLACDNLIAAELVTADGRLVRAAADENPDLLWALKGGGGNFGVVTAMEFRLHPVGPEVMAGLVIHPASRGREVVRLFRDVMHAAPDELGLGVLFFTAPDEPEIPADLRGRPAVAVGGMHCGSIEEGEEALREIRAFGPPAADLFGAVPYADFQCSLDDPPGYRNWWTAENLSDLTDEAIEEIARCAEQMPLGPAQFLIAPWGGAVARVGSDESPMAGRDARFVFHPLLLWEDPAQDEQMFALGRSCRDALAPHATGDTYLNFVGDEGEARVRAGFGEANYARLARVKAEWDPGDVLHANRYIKPSAVV